MKSRTFFSAIALAAGVIFLIGIAGFWGLTSQNPRVLLTKGGQEIPTAAQFVPRQAPVMVSLLARPDRLWQLRQLLTSPSQRFAARQEWQSLKSTITNSVGWDYEVDVRPWLDQEVTLAVTTPDLDHDASNGQQPGYLLILSCRDGQKAREAIHLLWQKRAISGRNLVFETVSGIPLIHDQKPTARALQAVNTAGSGALVLESLASAVVSDRYVLLANSPQVLRQAITTFQAPDVSLAQESTYRVSVDVLPSNRIGWIYANAPTLLAWLGLEEANDALPLASDGRRAHHLFMSFRATKSGLLGDTTIAAAPGTAFAAKSKSWQPPSQVLSLLPADTRFVISGDNLAGLLSETTESVGGYEVVQRSLDTFWESLSLPAATASATLSEVIQGEYALGMMAEPAPSWVLATQASTNNAFGSIDDLAQQQGLNVSHVRLGSRDVTAWTKLSLVLTNPEGFASLKTQVVGVHTQIGNYEVFSTSLLGLQKTLQVETKESSLLKQPSFVQFLETSDEPYGSLVYLDWPYLAPSLRSRFPWLRVAEQLGQPLTAHLGPVFTIGHDSSPSLQKGMVAINLVENS